MDISFDIKNTRGDQIRVALSYYDAEAVSIFSSDPLTLTLIFYDVSLFRINGDGYVGYKTLYAITETLAKFLHENEDAVLCFYCDPATEIRRNHGNLSPQEYRSRLFSRMFDLYTDTHRIYDFVNHRVKIENLENPNNSQFAHFICRKSHEIAIEKLGKLLMEK